MTTTTTVRYPQMLSPYPDNTVKTEQDVATRESTIDKASYNVFSQSCRTVKNYVDNLQVIEKVTQQLPGLCPEDGSDNTHNRNVDVLAGLKATIIDSCAKIIEHGHTEILSAVENVAATLKNPLLQPVIEKLTTVESYHTEATKLSMMTELVTPLLVHSGSGDASTTSQHTATLSVSVLNANNPFTVSPESDWGIYENLFGVLAGIKSNYLDVYTQVTQYYQEFLADFSDWKGTISSSMSAATDDSGDVVLNTQALYNSLTDLIAKWEKTPILTVDTQAEAQYWGTELGLPYKEENGVYNFYVDVTPLYALLDSISGLGLSSSQQITQAEFNVWSNALSAQSDIIQNDTQVMAQKFSQAVTIYNNLVKVLSSTIQALADASKSFLTP